MTRRRRTCPATPRFERHSRNRVCTTSSPRGVLYLLESAIRPGMSSTALLGFNQYTLEHMMPKKWRNKWGALDDEAATRRDRKLLTLGNLAIITHSLNASIRDADWDHQEAGKGIQGRLGPLRRRPCDHGRCPREGVLERGAISPIAPNGLRTRRWRSGARPYLRPISKMLAVSEPRIDDGWNPALPTHVVRGDVSSVGPRQQARRALGRTSSRAQFLCCRDSLSSP